MQRLAGQQFEARVADMAWGIMGVGGINWCLIPFPPGHVAESASNLKCSSACATSLMDQWRDTCCGHFVVAFLFPRPFLRFAVTLVLGQSLSCKRLNQ